MPVLTRAGTGPGFVPVPIPRVLGVVYTSPVRNYFLLFLLELVSPQRKTRLIVPAVGCVSIVRIILSAASVFVPWPCLANRIDRGICMRYCVHMGSYLDHLGWCDAMRKVMISDWCDGVMV